MSSYLTNSEKVSLNAEFYNLHETFARPIVVYQTATEVVVYTNPDNNILFDNAPFNSQTATIVNSGIINARILYGKKQPLDQLSVPRGPSTQNMILLEEGEVRLRVDATGAALLSSSERAVFDGTIFNIVANQRPHSLVGPPNFFDFYFKKLQ